MSILRESGRAPGIEGRRLSVADHRRAGDLAGVGLLRAALAAIDEDPAGEALAVAAGEDGVLGAGRVSVLLAGPGAGPGVAAGHRVLAVHQGLAVLPHLLVDRGPAAAAAGRHRD